MSYKYEQIVQCEKCHKLLGYAPYSRRDYLCPKCNGVPKEIYESEDPENAEA